VCVFFRSFKKNKQQNIQMTSTCLFELVTRKVVDDTKDMWDVHQGKGPFHCIVVLILSQRISFHEGKAMRKAMYIAVAPAPEFTPSNILMALKPVAHNLLPLQRTALQHVIEAGMTCSTMEEFQHRILNTKVAGIGPWTTAAFRLMTKAPGWETTFLWEDKWIAKRCRELQLPKEYACTGPPQWKGFEGLVSLFLWRLKPSGIAHLDKLDRSHFL
jgi:3-methyladenine DNA glycosylase/8-oxoguanine DNA glycosylase